MSYNLDSRGVARGRCSCEECEIYEMKDGKFPTCGYCGCPPSKHIIMGKSIQLSIHPSIHLSIHLSICSFINSSIHSSISSILSTISILSTHLICPTYDVYHIYPNYPTLFTYPILTIPSILYIYPIFHIHPTYLTYSIMSPIFLTIYFINLIYLSYPSSSFYYPMHLPCPSILS